MEVRLRNSQDVTTDKIGNDYLLACGDDIRILNSTAYAIWRVFQSPKTVDEAIGSILAHLVDTLDISIEDVKVDILNCIKDLLATGLLEDVTSD